MADNKTWTGERLETFIYNDTAFEHLHRYALAQQLSAGKRVLDIACGEGYGANLMAGNATEVVGVDISQETIDEAVEKYKRDNLKFLQGSADAIPCKSDYFDVVVSFETLEHHDRHHEMMQEVKRVLKADGLLIISSPDKFFYSDKPNYRNPFHVKELYKQEFQQLLDAYFKKTGMLSQSSFIGSVILTDNAAATAAATVFEGDYHQLTQGEWEAPYCVAVASDTDIPPAASSFFKSSMVLEERMQHVEQEMYAAITQQITQQVTDYVTHQVTERVTREVTEYVTHQVTAQVTERVTREVTDYVTYQVTESVTSHVTGEVTKRVTDEVTRRVTDEVTQQVTEAVTRQVTEAVTKQVTEAVTKEVASKTTAATTQQMQQTKEYKAGVAILKPFRYINHLFRSGQ